MSDQTSITLSALSIYLLLWVLNMCKFLTTYLKKEIHSLGGCGGLGGSGGGLRSGGFNM
jgi:hypothetical protein